MKFPGFLNLKFSNDPKQFQNIQKCVEINIWLLVCCCKGHSTQALIGKFDIIDGYKNEVLFELMSWDYRKYGI